MGDVAVDPDRRRVTVGGRAVELTATEFELVEHLARQPGRVFTRSQLLDVIHGLAVESYERAIDAHVKNIRRKLEPDPHRPRYVLTVHGVGYRFAEVTDEWADECEAPGAGRRGGPRASRGRPEGGPPWRMAPRALPPPVPGRSRLGDRGRAGRAGLRASGPPSTAGRGGGPAAPAAE